MKRCDYCGKEVSLNDFYCSTECEKKAVKHYESVNQNSKKFSIINVLSFFGIAGSLIWTMFQANVGLYILSGVLLVVAGLFYKYPFPTGNMTEKYKIEKSINIIKKIAIGIFVLAIIVTIVNTIVFYII